MSKTIRCYRDCGFTDDLGCYFKWFGKAIVGRQNRHLSYPKYTKYAIY